MSASPFEVGAGSVVSAARARRTAETREARPKARRVPPVCATFFVSFIVVLTAYIPNEGGPSPVDAVLVAASGFAALLLGTSASNQLLDRALVRICVAVWAYATLATIWTVFLSGDSLHMAIDVYSFLYLITPLLLLRQHPTGPRQSVYRAVIITSLLVSGAVMVLGSNAARASGSLANPNMAATWLGGALVLLACTMHRQRWVTHLLAILPLLAALFLTQSYSSFLAITVSLVYFTVVSTPRNAIRIPAVVAFGVLLLSWRSIVDALPAGDRVERSAGGREVIWTTAWNAWLQRPMGIGYGNFVNDRVAGGMMTHNDYLAVLVEMGPVGLLGLLALFATIWVVGRRATRAVLLFLMVNALTHNVLNFRHLWVFLAIALAYDLAAPKNDSKPAAVPEGEAAPS